MKKSTIITILAFALGIVVLAAGFILLTDNNISDKLFPTNTTTTTTTTGGTQQKPKYEPMDFFKEDVSKYITLGQYKELDIEVDQLEMSEEEIDRQIALSMVKAGKFEKLTEGNVKEGDVFNFNYVGYLDGVPFEGGHSAGQNAYILDGVFYLLDGTSFIEGFAEGMLNAKPGEWFAITTKFPDPYPNNKDLAGKEIIFDVKINYIASPNEPTDEIIKEITKNQYNTLESYKNYFNDTIKQTNLAAIWAQITKNATVVEIPEQQLNYVYSSLVSEIEGYAAYSQYYFGKQMTFDEVLVYFGFKNTDGLKEYAKELIKEELVPYAVMQAENLEITEEEYKLLLAELVTISGKTEDEVLKQYGGKDGIKQTMLLDEVNKLVLKENNLVVKEK